MTNLDIIRDAIDTLERQEITFAVASKLADLYIVRDHMEGVQQKVVTKTEPVAVEDVPMTEFMEIVNKVGVDKALIVIDELMTTLKAVNRRLYDGVIRQLTEP